MIDRRGGFLFVFFCFVEETARLSQTLSEFIDETDTKIKTIRTEHETQVEHLKQAFQTSQEMIKLKESEIENYARKCAFLETETEKLRKCGAYADDTGVSKILLLEKSFEGTFQKLVSSSAGVMRRKIETDRSNFSCFQRSTISS